MKWCIFSFIQKCVFRNSVDLWQCIDSIGSIEWSADTTIFTECRCQTLLFMYAVTHIVPIWQNREWIQRPYNISWGIRILVSLWMCIRISVLMMSRKNWNEWKSSEKYRLRMKCKKRSRWQRGCLKQYNYRGLVTLCLMSRVLLRFLGVCELIGA